MKQSVRLGRIAGIPIGLHWSVLVIVVLVTAALGTDMLPAADPGLPGLVYLSVAAPVSGLFFASLLAHELAHSIVARRSGVRVRAITLWMLGGVSELDDESPSPGADLAIAVVGPLTSLFLGLLFGAALRVASALGLPDVIVAGVAWLAFVNVALAVFNMLPGAPLDGGRVLRAILWRRSGDRNWADLAAARAGRVLGAGIAVLGIFELLLGSAGSGLWLVLVGWFLYTAARVEAASRTVREALKGLPVRGVMTPAPDVAAAWSTVGEFASRVALASRQSAFPVVDIAGAPVGILTLDMLTRVPPGQRGTSRLETIAVKLPPDYLVAPEVCAYSLISRRPLAGQVLAVVVEYGRVVGMVTAEDIMCVVRHATLKGPSHPAVR